MTAQEVFNNWKENIKENDEFFKEINKLENANEIEEKFSKQLAFNAAGTKAAVGLGTNKLNVYTVRRLSLGLSHYLNSAEKDGAVVIAFDTRKDSQRIAKSAAEILATYNRKVYIFRTPMPVSVLSYAIRYIKADAGIMISAGSSLKQLNGFKVYAGHGGLISAEAASGIEQEINKIEDIFNIERRIFDDLLLRSKVFYVPQIVYENYIEETLALRLETGSFNMKVVYTPLSGSGNLPVREMLKSSGYKRVDIVAKQENADGEFASCNPPDPENAECVALAIEQAKASAADIILATDPDAEKLGVLVSGKDGFVQLSSDDAGALLLNYILTRCKEKNILFKSPVAIKSKTESSLAMSIAKDRKIELVETQGGFRFIGEYIENLAKQGRAKDLVFAYTENGGFLFGTLARDADSVLASMLFCDMAAYYKKKKKDLITVLEGLKAKYGK